MNYLAIRLILLMKFFIIYNNNNNKTNKVLQANFKNYTYYLIILLNMKL